MSDVKKIATRDSYGNALVELGKEHENLVVINKPITAGIMPLTNAGQIQRMAILSGGASMPSKFLRMISKYQDNPEALKQAGIAYAVDQIIDLLSNDIDGIHLYTMNKPETAQKIVNVINNLFV